jgi:hypothetical protein
VLILFLFCHQISFFRIIKVVVIKLSATNELSQKKNWPTSWCQRLNLNKQKLNVWLKRNEISKWQRPLNVIYPIDDIFVYDSVMYLIYDVTWEMSGKVCVTWSISSFALVNALNSTHCHPFSWWSHCSSSTLC